jgi:hypothetical protein
MSLTAPRWPAVLLLGVVLVAGCGRASLEPSASATANAAASLQPLTKEEAIAAARPFAGAPPSAVVVSAEAGPFGQFDPDRNTKVSLPPADQWVWLVEFRDSGEVSSDVIIDYVTGALVETIRGIAN